MTKEELLAENERLGGEVAALRTLLAAVRDAATMPEPADWAHPEYCFALRGRLDSIAIYANPDMRISEGPRTPPMLHNAAEDLREQAGQPLRYAAKDAGPAPAGSPAPVVRIVSGTQSPAPVVRIVSGEPEPAEACKCKHARGAHFDVSAPGKCICAGCGCTVYRPAGQPYPLPAPPAVITGEVEHREPGFLTEMVGVPVKTVFSAVAE